MTKIGKKSLMFVLLIVVLGAFLIGSSALKSKRKWISLTSDDFGRDGEPAIQMIRADRQNLNLRMNTRGFFVQDRMESNNITYKILQIGKYNGDYPEGYPNLPVVRRYIYIPKGKR